MAALNLSSKANIEKAIASVSRRGKQLVNDCQSIAIAVMKHMDDHGDYTMVQSLCDSIEQAFGATRRKAMQEYFLNYTWLSYDESDKTFYKDKSKAMDIEGAKKAHWTDTEPKTVTPPFDASKAVKSLLQRAERYAKRDDETGDANAVNNTIEEMRRMVEEHDKANRQTSKSQLEKAGE